MKQNLLLLAAVLGLAETVWADAPRDNFSDLPLFAPKVKNVAVFKNGLAFVVKAGETPLQDGWARLDELPAAALGTLWISTANDANPVSEVVASWEKVADSHELTGMSDLLSANVGHPVVLTCGFGDQARTFEGRLLAAPAEGSPCILLQTTNAGQMSVLSLSKASILSLEVRAQPTIQGPTERQRSCTRIRVGGNPRRAEITVAALEKGLVWSPSYRIAIVGDTHARMEMDAVLMDDAEDLDHTEVSFVVGYPSFSFADVMSPLSLQESVASFVQALGAGGGNWPGRFANGLGQAVLYNSASFDASAPPASGYAAGRAMPGEQSQDLYFYHQQEVTLKKGDRAAYTVFRTDAPCEHVYEWDASDTMNVDERGYRTGPVSKPENQVWHVLRLENRGGPPWTTAPALVLNGGLPLAEDTLNYTPAGGRNSLRLTVATDVPAGQSQIETARRQVNLAGQNYDEVTVAGKLKVSNRKDREISLAVHKSIVGEVLEAPEGKAAKQAVNLAAVNPHSALDWEFKLAAGQDRECGYQYRVLLAR